MLAAMILLLTRVRFSYTPTVACMRERQAAGNALVVSRLSFAAHCEPADALSSSRPLSALSAPCRGSTLSPLCPLSPCCPLSH